MPNDLQQAAVAALKASPAIAEPQRVDNPEQLQALTKNAGLSEQLINVRLYIDEIHFYDAQLPVEVVHGILSPAIADCFILVPGKNDPPRTKGHYLHTSYIRELLLLDELPERK